MELYCHFKPNQLSFLFNYPYFMNSQPSQMIRNNINQLKRTTVKLKKSEIFGDWKMPNFYSIQNVARNVSKSVKTQIYNRHQVKKNWNVSWSTIVGKTSTGHCNIRSQTVKYWINSIKSLSKMVLRYILNLYLWCYKMLPFTA